MSNLEILYLTIMKLGGEHLIYKENNIIYSKADHHIMTYLELADILKDLY